MSGYVNAPVFYTKLFNPLVAGFYQTEEEPAMYMWLRVFNLYMIIQYMNVLERVEVQRNMVTNVQWNHAVLTELWGKVNLQASEEYRARLQRAWDKAPIGWTNNPVYDAVRWVNIKATFAKFNVLTYDWHTLAGVVSKGATLSNAMISRIVSVASCLTGLGEPMKPLERTRLFAPQ